MLVWLIPIIIVGVVIFFRRDTILMLITRRNLKISQLADSMGLKYSKSKEIEDGLSVNHVSGNYLNHRVEFYDIFFGSYFSPDMYSTDIIVNDVCITEELDICKLLTPFKIKKIINDRILKKKIL